MRYSEDIQLYLQLKLHEVARIKALYIVVTCRVLRNIEIQRDVLEPNNYNHN